MFQDWRNGIPSKGAAALMGLLYPHKQQTAETQTLVPQL
jgi:hypothetical protein